jgi:hypothetical protein
MIVARPGPRGPGLRTVDVTRSFRSREIHRDLVVVADEAVQLAVEEPLLIAVHAETLWSVLGVDDRAGAEHCTPFARSGDMSVAPVRMTGRVTVL